MFSFISRYRNTDILLLSRSLNSRILRPLIVIHHWWTSCRPWDHNWGFRPLLHIIIKQLRHSNLFSSLQIPSSSWLMSNPSSPIFFIYGSSAELRSSLDYGVSLQLRPSHLVHSIRCSCLPGGRLHVAAWWCLSFSLPFDSIQYREWFNIVGFFLSFRTRREHHLTSRGCSAPRSSSQFLCILSSFYRL